MDSLGTVVRRRREALGWTLSALAEAAGCTKGYLSGLENGRLANPPKRALLARLEAALGIADGALVRQADWQRTPGSVKAEVGRLAAESRALARWLAEAAEGRSSPEPGEGDDGEARAGDAGSGRPGRDLDAMYRSGALQRQVERHRANVDQLAGLCYQVPLINRVAAGYPSEFTDLDYPARVADEYLAVPELGDPHAFGARVVGDSMLPEYREGDIVVFSPDRPVTEGADCFARLLPDHETTFKRVYFEDERTVRLQPLNPRFAPRTVDREHVAGLYPAVYRVQKLG